MAFESFYSSRLSYEIWGLVISVPILWFKQTRSTMCYRRRQKERIVSPWSCRFLNSLWDWTLVMKIYAERECTKIWNASFFDGWIQTRRLFRKSQVWEQVCFSFHMFDKICNLRKANVVEEEKIRFPFHWSLLFCFLKILFRRWNEA